MAAKHLLKNPDWQKYFTNPLRQNQHGAAYSHNKMGDGPVYPMNPPHPDEGTSAYSQNVTGDGPVKTTRSAPQTPAVAQIGERKAKTEPQRNKSRSKQIELTQLDQQWTAEWETEGVRHLRQGVTPTVQVTAAVASMQSEGQHRAMLQEGHMEDDTLFWQQLKNLKAEIGKATDEASVMVTSEKVELKKCQ